MADELDFAFELTPLPDEEPFSLSDAMQFLRYGGILRFRLAGSDQPSQIDHGFLIWAKDGHLRLRLPDSDVVLNGPHVLDLAKAGSLFSLSKDAAPDPETRKAADVRLRNRRNSYETAKIKFAEAKVRYEQAVEAHRQWQVRKDEHAQQIAAWEASGKVDPKPECEKEPAIPNAPLEPTPPAEFDTGSLPTTWQAEMERRETELQIRLNEAARSGKLRMWGVQVNEPLCDEQSPDYPPEEPEEISCKYFYFGHKASGQSARNRYFDSDTSRIHAVPLHLPEVADREICAYAENPSTGTRFRSYSNVTLEREGLLALAAEIVPDLDCTDQIAHTDVPESIEPASTKEAPGNLKEKIDEALRSLAPNSAQGRVILMCLVRLGWECWPTKTDAECYDNICSNIDGKHKPSRRTFDRLVKEHRLKECMSPIAGRAAVR